MALTHTLAVDPIARSAQFLTMMYQHEKTTQNRYLHGV